MLVQSINLWHPASLSLSVRLKINTCTLQSFLDGSSRTLSDIIRFTQKPIFSLRDQYTSSYLIIVWLWSSHNCRQNLWLVVLFRNLLWADLTFKCESGRTWSNPTPAHRQAQTRFLFKWDRKFANRWLLCQIISPPVASAWSDLLVLFSQWGSCLMQIKSKCHVFICYINKVSLKSTVVVIRDVWGLNDTIPLAIHFPLQ